MDVPSRGVERENSLAPPTLDIYLPLSNLSLYDAARDLRTETATKISRAKPQANRFAYPFRSRSRGVGRPLILELPPHQTSIHRDTANLGCPPGPRGPSDVPLGPCVKPEAHIHPILYTTQPGAESSSECFAHDQGARLNRRVGRQSRTTRRRPRRRRSTATRRSTAARRALARRAHSARAC